MQSRSPGSRLAKAAFWVALALLAVFHFAEDRAGRVTARAFAREWGFDLRKPLLVEQISLEPSADFALGAMADGAVGDEIGSVRWKDLDAAERAAWMDALARRDEMLEAAHRLALLAVKLNPGFAFHAYRVGELAYLRQRREGAEALRAGRAQWQVPLVRATRLAPAFDAAWSFLGAALVESWPLLPERERAEARRVLKRAFLDAAFARGAFVSVSTELGAPEAVKLVPEVPASLAAAQAEVARAGNVEAAALLRARWNRAEATARAAELARLEERARMNDDDGLRAGCRAFVAAHPPRELSGPEGARQAARILELWPHDRAGSWRTDGRAVLLRYLLDGRSEGVSQEAVARAAGVLTGVPETDRARLALLAGDRYGWEQVLRDSKTVGTLEWTTFFVELARAELAAGRTKDAADALANVAPPARTECAVLLQRRQVAEAAEDEAEAEEAGRLLEEARTAWVGPEAWSKASSLPLCVDPRADEGAELRLNFAAEAPALLAWEVNGGRQGTFVVGPEGASLAVPLTGLQGMAVVALPLLAGPRPALVSASRSAATAAPVTSARVAEVAGMERLNSTSP